jgi:tetratricopeptide (TPR) repeat protein
MNRTRITLLALLLLVAGSGTTLAQDDVLQRAITINDSEGPAATLQFLEAEQAKTDLPPPAKALLGALLLADRRGAEAYELLEPISRLEQAPPAVLFNTWRAAAMSGKGMERIDLLERAAEIDPVSPAARQLGLLRGSQDRLEEAYLLLAPWSRANPEDTEARLAAAHSALQLRRIPEAEELLSDLPQEIPQVRLLWGKILFHRGDPYGALSTLQALGDGTDLPAGMDRDRRQTMANAYIAVGQGGEAAALLEGRVENDPGLRLVLSTAQSQSGDVTAALETIRPLAVAVLDGSTQVSADTAAGALLEYGQLLNSTGSQIDAIEPLQRAAEIDPGNERIWQSLGQSLAVAGRREEATEALARFNELAQNAVPSTVQQTTLERDIDDPTGGRLREALVLAGKDRAAEGLEMARSERRMAPGDPRVPLVESQILMLLNLQENALAAANDSVGIAPNYPDAQYQRAVVLMGMQRLQPAEEAFRQVLSLAPEHTPAMNDLAVLLMYLDRNEEARRLLQRALAINPDDQLAASNLRELGG